MSIMSKHLLCFDLFHVKGVALPLFNAIIGYHVAFARKNYTFLA